MQSVDAARQPSGHTEWLRALSSDLYRLCTSTRRLVLIPALVIASALVTAGYVLLLNQMGQTTATTAELATLLLGRGSMAPYAAAAAGALVAGSDIRYGQAVHLLTAIPRRERLMARWITLAGTIGVGLGVVGLLVTLTIASLTTSLDPTDLALQQIAQLVVGTLICCVFWAIAAVGTTTLMWSRALGLTMTVGMAMVVEPFVRTITTMMNSKWTGNAASYLPFGASRSLVDIQDGSATIVAPPVNPMIAFAVVVLTTGGILWLALHRIRTIEVCSPDTP